MRHRFLIADVFTDRPFAGNQLAVFPRAEAIPEAEHNDSVNPATVGKTKD